MTLRLTVSLPLSILFFFNCSTAEAQFSGELGLLPPGCEKSGQCTLKNSIKFVDEAGLVWQAAAGLVTDGASIPGVFQPFVGIPFEPAFIRAAVVHDHYCERHVRPWRATHRVFYEGLVAQGVSLANAKVMYLAVLLGGPKWIQLIEGKNCGKNCINQIKTSAGMPGFVARKADYTAKDLQPEMKRLADELKADHNALTLSEIEARAILLRPNDYYFLRGAELVVDEPNTF